MWSWRSGVIGLVVVGATAQVLAQDSAQLEPRFAPTAVPQPNQQAGPQQTGPQPKSAAAPDDRQARDAMVPHVSRQATPQHADAAPPELGRAANFQDRASEPPSSAPRLVTGDRSRPRSVRDGVRDRPMVRRGYRPSDGDTFRGADWPLDQNRRYEGPRDAYGGRWIYVRPARRVGARYGRRNLTRYAGYQSRTYGEQGVRPARPYVQQPAWREPWPDRRVDRRSD